MKIYTKTGDAGKTGLFQGPRVLKDDPRIEAYGTVDELSAVLGLARTTADERVATVIGRIQHELFHLGAELATPNAEDLTGHRIGPAHIGWLETQIDDFDNELPALKQFIVPGGTPTAATLHLARVVCRRAERRVVSLSQQETVAADLLTYLNRASDLFFVLARFANHSSGVPDILWDGTETAP